VREGESGVTAADPNSVPPSLVVVGGGKKKKKEERKRKNRRGESWLDRRLSSRTEYHQRRRYTPVAIWILSLFHYPRSLAARLPISSVLSSLSAIEREREREREREGWVHDIYHNNAGDSIVMRSRSLVTSRTTVAIKRRNENRFPASS